MKANDEIFFIAANQSQIIQETLFDIGRESTKGIQGLRRAKSRCKYLIAFSEGLQRIIKDKISDLEENGRN